MMSNEAKTTKAYKVSQEVKEKLEKLFADSEMDTQEAFIEHIATLYEMQLLKEGGAAGYKKQLDELEYHTRRSVELFLGMIETETAERLQIVQQHDEVLTDRASTIFSQEQEISELKKEAKQQSEELARLMKESEGQAKQYEQLQEISRKDNLLVEEYRQRIDTLSGLVNEYKAAAEENKELKIKVNELTKLTENQAVRVVDLEGDVTALQELKDEALRQQEERHKEALERLTERKEVEKERELLAVREEYRAKREKANDETTTQLRELYNQLEKLREELREQQQNELKLREQHEQQLKQIQQPKQGPKKSE